ncbi:hypothetical protein AMJ39_06085 [candidate division TA06 bacterium DG_24]|uniref:Histidinol-phosphate aminotransferase n=3 Tax=Bacteria division TA06 TaxID=1156500 RepID=A0A0S8JDU6_UNCT6|nr:MAG: hypothetical protein AMJ39_06085 [candidate division TA06 bacterium DG_24]KPK70411.1 MAG: hypothetical protein AMJ82_03380 [candidate division TA06 bacterium SM23_40]KPL07940.1 MAG: hypothetical protein AMJ71_08620 [candidate division TA06 bacterium SM1_40]
MGPLARSNVLEIKPYVPGKPIEEVQRQLGIKGEIIKLASNENPLGPSPRALAALRQACGRVNLYPDDGAYYLTAALAKSFGVDEDQIILGNGSVELIEFVAKAFLGETDTAVMSDQAFIMYRIVSMIANARRVEVPLRDYTHDLEAMADAIDGSVKVVYIANPNNPTGTMVSGEEVERFLDRVPESVVVVFDEAYIEYIERPDFPDSLRYVREGRNLVFLRTFSKAHGLAGLRVGYGIGPQELIEPLRKVRLPFNINMLGQEAALAALDDDEHIRRSREINAAGHRYLSRELDALGLFHTDSVGNFVFVDTGIDCKVVFQGLQRKGIIVRPLAGYGFPTAFRATVGTERMNKRFIKALAEVLAEHREASRPPAP